MRVRIALGHERANSTSPKLDAKRAAYRPAADHEYIDLLVDRSGECVGFGCGVAH
jgi:hypothetical protein